MLLALVLAASPACLEADVVTLNLKAGDTLARAAAWATSNLCTPYAVDAAVAKTKLPVSINGKVSRAQARGLFFALLRSVDARAVVDEGMTIRALEAPTSGTCDEAESSALAAEVKVINDTERVLTRKTIARMSECAARSARIAPSMKDGKPNGLKVFGVRPNSMVEALGFKNGDVLSTVNGHGLLNPDAAVRAWEEAKKASVVTVALVRQGLPVSLVIRVED